MSNKPLISIAIPTYNRANFLENLLNHIAPQAKESEGMVGICISNNGSIDNTREVVMSFQKKYPGLINYNENEKNLGVDRNLLKIMEMSSGEFIWLIGDDDLVVENGFKKVIDFINNHCNENTGLIILSHKSYFVDSKTGKEVVYFNTLEKDKPKVYKMDLKNIMGMRLINAFLSVMLFNNNFLKKILKEETDIIEKATGNYYVHAFLYQLMFLKYPKLEALRFNEIIINEDLHYSKFYIEDRFKVYYAARKRLDDLLLFSKYMRDEYKEIFINEKNKLRRGNIREMGTMKAFGTFNYFSFLGCIKLFFKEATLIDALLFSAFFIIFSIIPSIISKELYKIFVKIKYKKEWQKVWFCIVTTYSEMSKGSRRLIS